MTNCCGYPPAQTPACHLNGLNPNSLTAPLSPAEVFLSLALARTTVHFDKTTPYAVHPQYKVQPAVWLVTRRVWLRRTKNTAMVIRTKRYSRRTQSSEKSQRVTSCYRRQLYSRHLIRWFPEWTLMPLPLCFLLNRRSLPMSPQGAQAHGQDAAGDLDLETPSW